MSKKYKQKNTKKNEEIIVETNTNLSKKELYDIEKKKKIEAKEKKNNTKQKKKNNKKKKTYSTNIAGKIFAIVMLILMIGSVIATISYYFTTGGN